MGKIGDLIINFKVANNSYFIEYIDKYFYTEQNISLIDFLTNDTIDVQTIFGICKYKLTDNDKTLFLNKKVNNTY